MRRLVLLAVALAFPGVAAAQVSVQLPDWCTMEGREPPTSLLTVRARGEVDSVEVFGRPLRRAGEGFAGDIDLLPLLVERPLYSPVGDLELEVLGYRNGFVSAARVICRVHR